MIPSTWIPHHRHSDGELVGYLTGEDGAWVPRTLFGYPLADPSEKAYAIELLEARGLSCLAGRWWLHHDDREPVQVAIHEVSPERVVVVVDDFGAGGDLGQAVTLPVPESHRLRPCR